MSPLDDLRQQLDDLDTQLVETLAERARLVEEIWKWKREHGVERFDASREAKVRARLLELGGNLGLAPAALERVLSTIIGQPLR